MRRRDRSITLALCWIAILAVATLLRWLSPGRIALWRDEGQFLAIASLPDVRSIVAFLYHHESHPPLYYLLGRGAMALFGSIEEPMAAASLFASLIAVAVVCIVGAKALSPTAGLIAGAAMALSMPLTILTVQLRPYGLLSLAILVSHSALWAFWSGRGDRWLNVWFCSTLVIPYLHHVSVLVLGGQAILVASVQLRGMPLDAERWSRFLRRAALLAVLSIPAAYLLASQSVTAAYPSPKPFAMLRPFTALAATALSLPLEVLLPLMIAFAWLTRSLVHSKAVAAFSGARSLLTAPFPVFLLLATLASYRSHFLAPHLLLTMAPLGMLLTGSWIANHAAEGHRWRAAVWGEGVLVGAALGFLFSAGFAKTNTDLVARSVATAARPDDLIVLVPGAAGASFNRFFHGSNSRIDYPMAGRTLLYQFDRDFSRVADPKALQAARDSVHAAFVGDRRVWLVTLSRWLSDRVPTPEILSADSFGGLGQADRSRANRLDRYLKWLYGAPVLVVSTDTTLPGYELLTARLYERKHGGAADLAVPVSTRGYD